MQVSCTSPKTRSRSKSIKLTQIDKEVIPVQFCTSYNKCTKHVGSKTKYKFQKIRRTVLALLSTLFKKDMSFF